MWGELYWGELCVILSKTFRYHQTISALKRFAEYFRAELPGTTLASLHLKPFCVCMEVKP